MYHSKMGNIMLIIMNTFIVQSITVLIIFSCLIPTECIFSKNERMIFPAERYLFNLHKIIAFLFARVLYYE